MHFWDVDRVGQTCSFYMFLGAGKRRVTKPNKTDLGRAEIESCRQIIIQGSHLSLGSGHFGWFYIRLFDNAWRWRVVGGFGRPLDFEGVQQSNTFIYNQHKLWNNGGQERCLNKHEIMMEKWCEKEVPWDVTQKCSHYTCCNLIGLVGHDNCWKMEHPKHLKSITILHFGTIGSGFVF